MKGRLFTFTAAASALLFLATAIAISRDLALHFSRRGVEWELAIRGGRLWLDNQPQMKLHSDREAAVRAIFDREPWGSPAYRKALDELKRLDEPPQPQPGRPKAAVLPVEYSLVALGWVLSVASVFPLLWLLVRTARWLRDTASGRGSNVRWPARVRLLNCLASISMLLLISVAVLWVRSLFLIDAVVYNFASPAQHSLTSIGLWSANGTICFAWTRRFYFVQTDFLRVLSVNPADPDFIPRTEVVHEGVTRVSGNGVAPPKLGLSLVDAGLNDRTPITSSFWGRRGFVYVFHPGSLPIRGPRMRIPTLLGLPHWLVMLFCSIAPALWIRRRLRIARFVRQGLCPACGYDLRATPNRCPECGAVPEGAAA